MSARPPERQEASTSAVLSRSGTRWDYSDFLDLALDRVDSVLSMGAGLERLVQAWHPDLADAVAGLAELETSIEEDELWAAIWLAARGPDLLGLSDRLGPSRRDVGDKDRVATHVLALVELHARFERFQSTQSARPVRQRRSS